MEILKQTQVFLLFIALVTILHTGCKKENISVQKDLKLANNELLGVTPSKSLPITRDAETVPVLEALSIYNYTINSAMSSSNIISNGGGTISQHGVCWIASTSVLPTFSDNYISQNGGAIDSFACKIEGLIPYTTYSVRAYATNEFGTGYSEVKSFTTLINLPIVRTINATYFKKSTVCWGGEILSSSPVTQRGICWSYRSNPSIADNKISVGQGMGIFSTQTFLSIGVMIYYRAYAINYSGLAYGRIIGLKLTKSGIELSIVD